MKPEDLTRLREAKERAEKRKATRTHARRIARELAASFRKLGKPLPPPRELKRAAMRIAEGSRADLDARLEKAFDDAVGTPLLPQQPIVSAGQFVRDQIEREAAIVRVQGLLGAEMDEEPQDIRLLAETLLIWTDWLDQAAVRAGIGKSRLSPEENVVRIIKDMRGEWADIDAKAYVAAARERMGIPETPEAPAN